MLPRSLSCPGLAPKAGDEDYITLGDMGFTDSQRPLFTEASLSGRRSAAPPALLRKRSSGRRLRPPTPPPATSVVRAIKKKTADKRKSRHLAAALPVLAEGAGDDGLEEEEEEMQNNTMAGSSSTNNSSSSTSIGRRRTGNSAAATTTTTTTATAAVDGDADDESEEADDEEEAEAAGKVTLSAGTASASTAAAILNRLCNDIGSSGSLRCTPAGGEGDFWALDGGSEPAANVINSNNNNNSTMVSSSGSILSGSSALTESEPELMVELGGSESDSETPAEAAPAAAATAAASACSSASPLSTAAGPTSNPGSNLSLLLDGPMEDLGADQEEESIWGVVRYTPGQSTGGGTGGQFCIETVPDPRKARAQAAVRAGASSARNSPIRRLLRRDRRAKANSSTDSAISMGGSGSSSSIDSIVRGEAPPASRKGSRVVRGSGPLKVSTSQPETDIGLRNVQAAISPDHPDTSCWFHGNISREESTRRLVAAGPGHFIVREKTPGTIYALDVITRDNALLHRLLTRSVRDNGELGAHWLCNRVRLLDAHCVEDIIRHLRDNGDLGINSDTPFPGVPCLPPA